ncbi:hypothetical protein KSF78_0009655 [Schistosoma japonicum]|nr:hypothetical protein KSF78_0009655 [Schistosoma japonicum]
MFINKLNSRINWKITLHFILLLKYSSIATEYQLNITTLNSRQQTKYAKNSLNTFINSLIQSYKIHHHHHAKIFKPISIWDTICKSEYTWKDITIPWRILMKNFNSNCSHILGNLIISELDEGKPDKL